MSLVSFQNAQISSSFNKFQMQGSVYSNRTSSYSNAQGTAMNRAKGIIKNNLSAFSTFA